MRWPALLGILFLCAACSHFSTGPSIFSNEDITVFTICAKPEVWDNLEKHVSEFHEGLAAGMKDICNENSPAFISTIASRESFPGEVCYAVACETK